MPAILLAPAGARGQLSEAAESGASPPAEPRGTPLAEAFAPTVEARLQARRRFANMNMRPGGGAGNSAAERDKWNPGLT